MSAQSSATRVWRFVFKPVCYNPAPTHVLRLKMDTAGSGTAVGNFNWLKIQ